MAMTDMYIGYTLSRVLEEHGMKPIDLAGACDVPRANVTIYTSGRKRMPRFEQAWLFCDAIGISMDDFWKECERDWQTDMYRRWVRMCDMRYKRGEYAEHDGAACSSGQFRAAPEGSEMVAGGGVEPSTQGFSVPRYMLLAS